jgi:hypothetical protein
MPKQPRLNKKIFPTEQTICFVIRNTECDKRGYRGPLAIETQTEKKKHIMQVISYIVQEKQVLRHDNYRYYKELD